MAGTRKKPGGGGEEPKQPPKRVRRKAPKPASELKGKRSKAPATTRPRRAPGLSIEETAARVRLIVKIRLLFPTWTFEQIAAEVTRQVPRWKIAGESVRTAYRRWQDQAEAEFAAFSSSTPQVIQEHIAGLRLLRELSSTIVLEATTGRYEIQTVDGKKKEVVTLPNHSNALGAITRVADLQMAEILFMQEMNILPKHLGAVKIDIDAKAMVRAFFEVLARHFAELGASERLPSAQAELLEALRPAAPARVLDAAPIEHSAT